jgi:CheY-like chemotaxis protein
VSVRWDGARFVIVVSDTGQGISRGALPFIFETFRQADASITRSFGGLGLGLSISRHLVELHGGRIEADSAGVGQGATFTVRLPQAPSFAPDARKPRRSLTPSSGGLQRPRELSGLRVLVVDDEADARELITTILSYAGAIVSGAASAAQALRILAETPIDVMLSDIGMPGQDGYDLIRRVRQLPGRAARIPAAALTAFARDEDRALAVAAGYHQHVAKPIDPIDLLGVVATLSRIRESSPPTRS